MEDGHRVAYWSAIFAAAVLEFAGDALIRRGVQKWGCLLIIPGFLTLGLYGLVINLLSGPDWVTKRTGWDLSRHLGFRMDFSQLLGVYVAAFALVSVAGSYLFIDRNVPASTWVGLAVIVAGGLIIQYG